MKFPYVEFLGLAEDRVFRPLLPVVFEAGTHAFQTYALVDSGADYVILPLEVAGKFGFKLSDVQQYRVLAAGGSAFTVYRSPLPLKMSVRKKGFRDVSISSFVYFAESGSTILLGQKGFLDQLDLRLDGVGREVEIKLTHAKKKT